MRSDVSRNFLINALSNLCNDQETLDTATSVILQVGILLNYTQRTIPDFTDHGALHSANVINNLCHIIDGYSYQFTSVDRLLLGIAAIVHDFGCIVDRNNHAEESVEILDMEILRSIRDLLTVESFRYLKTIVASHSSNYDLTSLLEREHIEKRLILLCCIFRIADECDHSSERVNKLVFDIYKQLKLLDSKQEKEWGEHLEIEKINLEGTLISIYVNSPMNKIPWLQKLEKEISVVNTALEKCGFPKFVIDVTEVPSIH